MYMDSIESGGFIFENCLRNETLQKNENINIKDKCIKTGTTIAAMIFKDGVILGADTRSTEGPIVADKNCEKIHYLTPNIYCCGAGTAADCDHVTRMMSRQMELHSLNSGRRGRLHMAATRLRQMLVRYGGYIGAYLILGGVDCKGPHVCSISANGTMAYHPFFSLGSGSLGATAVLETNWHEHLTMEDGMKLMIQAIEAGIYHDMGSGSNVDLCVITEEGAQMHRNYVSKNAKEFEMNKQDFQFKPDQINVIDEEVFELPKFITMEEGEQPMEI